jgi:phosphatidylinositol alpha-1,6-mannosyltransferase
VSRTLVVTNDFPPRHGGIPTFVRSLCDAFPPDDLVVYASRQSDDSRYDATLPFRVLRDPTRILLPTPAVGRRVTRVLRDERCDRVVFGAAAPLGLLGEPLRAAGARRLVALTHGHEVWWARLPGTRGVLRRIGDAVDVVTYVSEWCRARIAPALSPGAAAAMQRLSPGVDTGRFHPGCGGDAVRARLGLDTERLVVVCVGRLVRRKGHDALVRAWPDVLAARPGSVLLLVGTGPLHRRLRRLVRRQGLDGAVRLLGAVDDLPPYLDAADVFAMPCRSVRLGLEVEAFGIVYLEAAACGLPVVAGRSGGVPEVVAMLDDAVVVDGRDPGEVAAAVLALAGRRTAAPRLDLGRSDLETLRTLLEDSPAT